MISFFEIRRCANVLFESVLVMNSTSSIWSIEVKNSLSDLKSFRNTLMRSVFSAVTEMLSVISSKYWIISSWTSFFSFSSSSYFRTYWRKRLMFLNWEYRSEKRFFELLRSFSKWLIDQQSDFWHTKHLFEKRFWFWNLSFNLSRNSFRNSSRRSFE